MSTVEQGLAQEINRIKDAVTESYDALRGVEVSLGRAYDAIASMGGTVPENKTIENLTQAITTVSGGGGSESGDIWWSPRMTSNTTSTASLCGDDNAINSDYGWWTPRMISNTEAVRTSLAETELQEKTVSPASSVRVVTPDSEYDGLSKVTVSAAPLQEKTVSPASTTQVVTPDNGNYGLSKVSVGAAILQEKSVTPTATQQIITPDSAYYGLSKVTVEATLVDPKLQAKTATPTTSQQVITPDSSYDGLSKVTVSAVSLQSKSVTPSTSSQTVSPGSGYLGLSQVSVGAIPSTYKDTSDATASASDILSGKTAYINGSKVTGTYTAPAVGIGTVTYSITFSSALQARANSLAMYFPEVGSSGTISQKRYSLGYISANTNWSIKTLLYGNMTFGVNNSSYSIVNSFDESEDYYSFVISSIVVPSGLQLDFISRSGHTETYTSNKNSCVITPSNSRYTQYVFTAPGLIRAYPTSASNSGKSYNVEIVFA